MAKIYLGHPGIARKQAKKLQLKLEKLGFEVFNPFDSTEEAQNLKKDWDANPSDENGFRIFDHDLSNVNNCDILVAYVPKTFTCGTPIELYYAFSQGKIVYVYSKIKSPWLIVPSGGKVFSNFSKILQELEKYVC